MGKTILSRATPEQLATLLSCDMSEPAWSSSDIATMWRQLCAAPVLSELERSGAATPVMENLCAIAHPPILTFGDLIGHPAPPEGILDAVRRMSKLQALSTENSGTSSVALALYYTILATAPNRAVTKLTDEQLTEGFQWTLAQSWLDVRTRELLTQALSRIQGK